MNTKQFLASLHSRYEGFDSPSCRPISSAAADLLAEVPGMTTPNVIELLNHAVSCMDRGVYCEIGCHRGATLCGAMQGNVGKLASGVDNFSEFNDTASYLSLLTTLNDRGLKQVQVFNMHFERFLSWYDSTTMPRIDVLFYDAAHDYRSTLLALLMAQRHLSYEALIILDDWNFSHVRLAMHDFLLVHPFTELIFERRTECNGAPDWWNGIAVFAWRHPPAQWGESKIKEAWRPWRVKTAIDRIYGVRDGEG